MGLFGGDSSSSTQISQADNRQFASDSAKNIQADNRSSVGFLEGDAQMSSLIDSNDSVQVAAKDNARVNSIYSRNSNINVVYENLDAELAKHSIDKVATNVKENLAASLGFANEQLDKVFAFTQNANNETIQQLEDTRNFSAGLIDKVSTTSDERLESLSKGAFITIAALFGLVIWKVT